VRQGLQLLLGHLLLHLLEVEELGTLLHLVRQLLLQLVPQRLQLGLVLPLHLLHQPLPLPLVLAQLAVGEGREGVELFLVGVGEVALLLGVALLHFVDPAGF